MPPKKADAPVKRGRGRPPKGTSTIKPTIAKATPSKPRGRPAKTTPSTPAAKATKPSTPKRAAKAAKDVLAPKSSGVKKRGRPPGSKTSTTTKKSYQKAPPKSSPAKKGGRPKGKHTSNLDSNLKSLISSSSKGRLAELLSVLCERNAVVAKATSNALREERIRDEEKRETNGEETAEAGDAADGNGKSGALDGAGEVLAKAKDQVVKPAAKAADKAKVKLAEASSTPAAKKAKAKVTEASSTPAAKKVKAKVTKAVGTPAAKTTASSANKDQAETEKEAPEPASGYEADVEPGILATATETAGGMTQTIRQAGEDAVETIAQAVSSVRDSAFGL